MTTLHSELEALQRELRNCILSVDILINKSPAHMRADLEHVKEELLVSHGLVIVMLAMETHPTLPWPIHDRTLINQESS